MKAPDPHVTSRRIASQPDASFFDMMLAAIRGMDSMVAVTSLSAYRIRSAGQRSPVWPMMTAPFSFVRRYGFLRLKSGTKPRNAFQLVQCTAGKPQAAPGHLHDRNAAGSDEGDQNQGRRIRDARRWNACPP